VRIGHGMKTALRLLFSAEAAGVSPSRGDLVGELCDRGQIGERAAYFTLARLMRNGLVKVHRGMVRLTDNGQAYVRRRIIWWGGPVEVPEEWSGRRVAHAAPVAPSWFESEELPEPAHAPAPSRARNVAAAGPAQTFSLMDVGEAFGNLLEVTGVIDRLRRKGAEAARVQNNIGVAAPAMPKATVLPDGSIYFPGQGRHDRTCGCLQCGRARG
jgi:hypothetical protein